MKRQIDSQMSSRGSEERRFIDYAWPRDPHEEPRVKRWRAAARTTLFMLGAYAGLQYYFFDLYLTIMAMPQVGVLAALP